MLFLDKRHLITAILFSLICIFSHPLKAKEIAQLSNVELEKPLEIALALRDVGDTTLLQALSPLYEVGRYNRAISILKSRKNVMSDGNLFLPLLLLTYATRDYETLASLCREWIDTQTTRSASFDSVVYEFLGTACRENKQFSEAKFAFSKSIELCPRPRALIARSKVNLELGNKEESTADCFAVLKKWQKFDLSETLGSELDSQLFQGIWYPLLETRLSEDSDFSKASSNTRSLLLEAERLEDSGQFENAEGLYATASKNSDFDAAMWNAYGLCMATSTVIATDPRFDDACSETAARKRAGEVEKVFEKAIELNKNDWRIWSNLGSLKIQLGDKVGGANALKIAAKAAEMPASQKILLGKMLRLESTLDLLNKRFGNGSK